MALNINSLAYYSAENGIIDELYQMCSVISRSIKLDKYTDCLDSIGITPIVAPRSEIDSGKWKEVKKILISSRIAIISLQIDYDIFCRASVDEKKEILLQNILDSLSVVKKKLGDSFDLHSITEDILLLAK